MVSYILMLMLLRQEAELELQPAPSLDGLQDCGWATG